jgi:hypothetical protein
MNPEPWNPGQLLKVSGDYWQTCALHGGVKLDVFTLIGGSRLTAGEIAQKLHGDLRGVTMLLNALTAMKLLVKTGDAFAGSDAAKAYLSKDSDQYLGHMIMHHHHLMESWTHLDQAVRTGKPQRARSAENDFIRESFLMGMFNLAMQIAPRLAAEVDLSGRCRLLDLGGGPGTYAIHFCLKNPQLKATVYDLPTTRPFAEKTIARFGLSDRIRFMAGDFLEEPVGGPYDVAWLSHVLHGEGPEACRRMIGNTVSALEPGGEILIQEFILNNGMDGPLHPTLFSLNMLLGTTRGQSYSEQQIMDMLTAAGVRTMERLPFRTPNDAGIIRGIV